MLRFSDNFNRADATDLGPDWDSGYTSFNNLQIVGGKVRGTVIAQNSHESVNISLPNDQSALATLTLGGSVVRETRLLLRMAAPPTRTWYSFNAENYAGQKTAIFKTVDNVTTQLAEENTITWATGDVLKAVVTGSDLKLFRIAGGVQNVILSATDSAIVSGRAGLGSFVDTSGDLADNQFDGYEAHDLIEPGLGVETKPKAGTFQQITAGFAS